MASLNLAPTRESAQQDLVAMLDRMANPKALVVDPTLSGPLSLVADSALLKEHGVTKSVHLKNEPLDVQQRRVIYLVRGNTANMKIIAEQIRFSSRELKQSMEYYVCLVPRSTIMCERVLEEEGVYGDMQIGDLDLGLIPIKEDMLSMEMPDLYRECELMGDKTGLFYAAKSIMRLQLLYGMIPHVRGKGENAKQVADFLVKLSTELGDDGPHVETEIDELIIVDRETDMVSLMMTPLTYEGLIDDFFGFNNGIVALPGNIVLQAQGKHAVEDDRKMKVKVPMGSTDVLFTRLRDVTLEQVGKVLADRANELSGAWESNEDDERRFKLHQEIIKELRWLVQQSDFIRKIEVEHAIVRGEISVDKALDFIDEMMYMHAPFPKVMRMLCLLSLVFDGVKKFDFYSSELVQVYGPETIFAVKNLEKCGLWKPKTSGNAISNAAASLINKKEKPTLGAEWDNVKKALNLLVDDLDQNDPYDVGYVHSGYAPISVRLVEMALVTEQDKWLGRLPDIRCVPGPIFALKQRESKRRAARDYKNVMVFYVGGVTPAEASGVRFVGEQYNKRLKKGQKRVQMLVGTTKMSGGDGLLESIGNIPVNNVRAPVKK